MQLRNYTTQLRVCVSLLKSVMKTIIGFPPPPKITFFFFFFFLLERSCFIGRTTAAALARRSDAVCSRQEAMAALVSGLGNQGWNEYEYIEQGPNKSG